MKEKAIVSTSTLVVSLLTYWYAKAGDKDAVPYVMFGGFIGALIGESIAEMTNKNSNKT